MSEHDDENEERDDNGEEHKGLRERLKDIATDAADLVDDVVGTAIAAVDAVEDRIERVFHRGDDDEEDEDEDEEDEDGADHGRRAPWRPTRHPGTSRGELDGRPITPGEIKRRPPAGSWPGPRKDLWLPYLFFRANPGDTGTRPLTGPFWESPDVFILAGVKPSEAPPVPPALGQTAMAHADNTVYAHVWNFGHAPARDVVVEFRWCNPALGINLVSSTIIGYAFTSLGARGSGDSHKVVKCPESWAATYVNGGHECLLVRAWDVADPLTTPEWDASVNRHLAQRNIHVVSAAGAGFAAGADVRGIAAPDGSSPLRLSVGPLFGHPADISVARHEPTSMPWLQLHTGVRGSFPLAAVPTGNVAVGRPGEASAAGHVNVHGNDAEVVVAMGDGPPPPGQAHVYRVTASQDGLVFGGYTVVLLG
jgi:hypothetical protein